MKKIATMAFLALFSAATPALAGSWYLMGPPDISKIVTGTTPVVTGSLKGWTQEESFDSAAQCKRKYEFHVDLAERGSERLRTQCEQIPKQEWDANCSENWFWGPMLTYWTAAQCVASNDPRLAR